MSNNARLVLSLFPGLGLLDRAFEECGFCVVRGPDLLWGGDIQSFHPPQNKFHGVIGGPPCQAFSALRHLVENNGYSMRFGNLIPEFERCVAEALPEWFLMENVPAAPTPTVDGYKIHERVFNNRWFGGIQNRVRRFTWGSRSFPNAFLYVQEEVLEQLDWSHAVCGDARTVPVAIGGSGKPKSPIMGRFTVSVGDCIRSETKGDMMPVSMMCELQGLPANFADEMPFTVSEKRKAIGNGVPLPLGRGIAKAVLKVITASSK